MEEKKPANTEEQPASPPAPGRGRRRFLQGSLGVAPVAMTLVSRPVLGVPACAAPSAHGSMPNSHGRPNPAVCSGASPTFWSGPQNFDQWPSPYVPRTLGGNSPQAVTATLFSAAFSPSPYPPDATLLSVLETDGVGGGVASHLVAAKLNVAKGWVPVLDDASIQTIWLEFTSQGYYEPTAGVQWYAPDIVAYLQSLETQ